MTNNRLFPFLILIEVVVVLILMNYYFNPLKFHSKCKIGQAFSQQLGNSTIVDCVACLYLDNRDIISSALIADLEVIIPTKNEENDQGKVKALSNVKEQNGEKSKKFLYMGQLYGQIGCQSYKCSDLLVTSDFGLTQNDHYFYLKSHKINRVDVEFEKEFNSLKVVTFTGRPELSYRKVSSSSFIGDYNSLAIRFRYILREEMEQKQPTFLLFQILNNTFVKLLLLAPLLLSILQIKAFLYKESCCLGLVFLFFMTVAFLNQYLALMASVLCIFILVAQLAKRSILGWILSLGVVLGKIMFDFQYISFPLVCVIISGVLPIVFNYLQGRQPFMGHIIVLESINLILASTFSWTFLAIVTPLHLLLVVVYSIPVEQQKQGKDNNYRKANEYFEEDEDVLLKIDKVLEGN